MHFASDHAGADLIS